MRNLRELFLSLFIYIRKVLKSSLGFLRDIIFFLRDYLVYLFYSNLKKKYYISVLAIFKNENPWIREWIEYHKLVGVEHFYLYNNDDETTESDAILASYVKEGTVDNIHLPGKVRQFKAYKEGIKLARGETEWLAVIDLDEFIFPVKEDYLKDILRNYEQYAGLVVNWHCFGSSGFLKRPPNQINNFLNRAEKNFEKNRHIKSIVKPTLVDLNRIINPHFFSISRVML